MPFDAVGIGLCAWDTILLFDGYPGPNQKVEAVDSVTCGGGPVPTALAVFGRLGGRAAFVGAIGDRQEGLKIRCDLERYGVDVSALRMRPDRHSPSAYIWVDKHTGDRTVALAPGDVEPIQVEEVPKELFVKTPLLLIDGRQADVCLRAAQLCRQGGGEVVLDAGSPRDQIEALLHFTDHAIVSTDFVEGTFPGLSAESAIEKIKSLGPSRIIITQGERGGRWLEDQQSGRYEAFEVPVLDTTGAGDAFHGAYLYGLKRGWDMQRRCRFSSAVAALVCRGLGGRATAPDYEEVTFFLGSNTEDKQE